MRYNRLKKIGIINGEIMQVNPYSLGYTCVGNIGVKTSAEFEKAVMEFLKEKEKLSFPIESWGKSNIEFLVVKKNIEEWAAELRSLEVTSHIKLVDNVIWASPTGMDHAENLIIKPLEKQKWENTIEQTPTTINNAQVELDEIDRQIAKILIHNSRISFRKIGKQLNISTKNVIQRYKKLSKSVLTLSTVTLDLKKLGYKAVVRVFLKCERSKMSEISNKILQMPNMIVFIRLIGSYDLLAIAALEDLSDFIRLQNKMHTLPGAEEIDFSIIEMWPQWPLSVFSFLLE
jgi:DNA-binding Lrp family transcriptional regulator